MLGKVLPLRLLLLFLHAQQCVADDPPFKFTGPADSPQFKEPPKFEFDGDQMSVSLRPISGHRLTRSLFEPKASMDMHILQLETKKMPTLLQTPSTTKTMTTSTSSQSSRSSWSQSLAGWPDIARRQIWTCSSRLAKLFRWPKITGLRELPTPAPGLSSLSWRDPTALKRPEPARCTVRRRSGSMQTASLLSSKLCHCMHKCTGNLVGRTELLSNR